ncbi:hypothetical protein NHX12_007474 [Muraenolepis orangiensis]|uniref:Uncharacterized protein n=1 Tax=Muraenolepis orangiensis TaxID=630683 RepID=A0A9Q0I9Q0_9TELE|nr:hypothetical protein NHX12_007474 [Muraenolepis orangiensis]
MAPALTTTVAQNDHDGAHLSWPLAPATADTEGQMTMAVDDFLQYLCLDPDLRSDLLEFSDDGGPPVTPEKMVEMQQTPLAARRESRPQALLAEHTSATQLPAQGQGSPDLTLDSEATASSSSSDDDDPEPLLQR